MEALIVANEQALASKEAAEATLTAIESAIEQLETEQKDEYYEEREKTLDGDEAMTTTLKIEAARGMKVVPRTMLRVALMFLLLSVPPICGELCPQASPRLPITDLTQGLNWSQFDHPSANPHMRYTKNVFAVLVSMVAHAAKLGEQQQGQGRNMYYASRP